MGQNKGKYSELPYTVAHPKPLLPAPPLGYTGQALVVRPGGPCPPRKPSRPPSWGESSCFPILLIASAWGIPPRPHLHVWPSQQLSFLPQSGVPSTGPVFSSRNSHQRSSPCTSFSSYESLSTKVQRHIVSNSIYVLVLCRVL